MYNILFRLEPGQEWRKLFAERRNIAREIAHDLENAGWETMVMPDDAVREFMPNVNADERSLDELVR